MSTLQVAGLFLVLTLGLTRTTTRATGAATGSFDSPMDNPISIGASGREVVGGHPRH